VTVRSSARTTASGSLCTTEGGTLGRNAPSHTPSGRGLRIVETVATRWGTDPDESGKWVWALLNGR
jgi:hypothetical protein